MAERTLSKDLKPGTVLHHVQYGSTRTLSRRKDDNSGWWLTGNHGGLVDWIIDGNESTPPQWEVVSEPDVPVDRLTREEAVEAFDNETHGNYSDLLYVRLARHGLYLHRGEPSDG